MFGGAGRSADWAVDSTHLPRCCAGYGEWEEGLPPAVVLLFSQNMTWLDSLVQKVFAVSMGALCSARRCRPETFCGVSL